MRAAAAIICVFIALTSHALADDASLDPIGACARSAARVEQQWHLPAGLLAAIGTVESARGGLGSARPVAWPWSINVSGRGLYLPSKAAAVAAVRAFLAHGHRFIDVGCFQVDLFYHPAAFATLEAAFDPDANAQAAAGILTRSRQGSGSWESAIALYHSASALLGARYLQQVRSVWPWARLRSARALDEAPDAFAVLLSPAARSVRVLTGDDPLPETPGLPRILNLEQSNSVVQWAAMPLQDLPVALSLPPTPVRRGGGRN